MKSKSWKTVKQHNEKETKKRTSKVSSLLSFFSDSQTLKTLRPIFNTKGHEA